MLAHYERIIRFFFEGMNRVGTLEEDQALLQIELEWETKMAIVYRIEKKKIIISQLRLIEWLKSKVPN